MLEESIFISQVAVNVLVWEFTSSQLELQRLMTQPRGGGAPWGSEGQSRGRRLRGHALRVGACVLRVPQLMARPQSAFEGPKAHRVCREGSQ